MQQSTSQESPCAYLIRQDGKRWTEVVRINAGENALIGRSSQCEIVVKEDAVSRKHAEIKSTPSGWVVQDLGSRNGTLINRTRIDEAWKLTGGEIISVGSCDLRFTETLSSTNLPIEPVSNVSPANSQTLDLSQPSIVDRQGGSQWSIPTPGFLKSQSSEAAQAAFFYGLVYDLVLCTTEQAAAQTALDQLVDQLGVGSGGVIKTEVGGKPKTPQLKSLEVLATRQASSRAYRRLSDFLLQNVIQDKQAILAKNVSDDSMLSTKDAQASSPPESVQGSVACAPVFETLSDRDKVIAVVHVYTEADQRPLNKDDLDIIVGVADNLSISLAKQNEKADLQQSLEKSRRQIAELKEQLSIASSMVGTSEALSRVREAIQRAGPTNATVLIRGESGVGKELVAREIHDASMRKDAPLVCLNCAALAPTLLESELFGHEKGAFTGATERKIGKFEAAHQGTIFLDEIGEMPLELQAKFLRVLEGQPFERLGGHKPIHTDVRVVAATNRDLEDAVREKEFRSDLYFRLRVIEMQIPPLRSRRDDIPLLVEHFMNTLGARSTSRVTGVSPEAMKLMIQHAWPGNVRELRNAVERALVLGDSELLMPEDLNLAPVDPSMLPQTASAPLTQEYRELSLAELEREHIQSTLEHTEGNKSAAAKILGIERSTLDRKLKRY